MGREDKYFSHVLPYLDNISGWIKEGYFLKDVAVLLGVGVSTLRKYAREYEELDRIIKCSETFANALITNALFKSAIGHSKSVQKAFKVKHGNEEKIEVVEVNEYYEPNVKAAELWALNRNSSKWKKISENKVELSGDVNLALEEKIKSVSGEKF